MYFEGKTVLIISPENWGACKLSKHHYALTLANQGVEVFFLYVRDRVLAKNYKKHIGDNLVLIEFSPLMKGLNKLPEFISNLVYKIEVRRLEKLSGKHFDIIWSFNPYWCQNLKLFKSQRIIYHQADIHRSRILEFKTESRADIVLSTSKTMIESLTNKNKHFIGHGVSEKPFVVNNQEELRKGIKVGFVGNLNQKYIDYDTLFNIIRSNPNIYFYFYGPSLSSNLSVSINSQAKIDYLKKFPNVMIMGVIESELLLDEISKMDLFLICFKDQFRKETSNPHKVLEFLITGKVIVSSYLQDYEDCEDILLMSHTNQELPDLFRSTIVNLGKHNTPLLIEKRRETARKNSYENKIKQISSLFENV